MLGIYSIPESGYTGLWPRRDLGPDKAIAFYKAGIRSNLGYIPKATGYAKIVKSRPVHLSVKTIEGARSDAMKDVSAGPVNIVRAVARGKFTVYERIERLVTMNPSEAQNIEAAAMVAPGGILLSKAANPFNPTDQKILADHLASQLRYEERKVLGTQIRDMLDDLDYNWPHLSASEIDAAIASVRTQLFNIMDDAGKNLMPMWKSRINVSINGVVGKVRRTIRDQYIPQVGLSLDVPDQDAVNQIADQNGWFLRNNMGKRSVKLTKAGRKIVQQGLDEGLGRYAIGEQLKKQLPKLATQYGKGYAETVAANAISRAKSWSEVTAYESAGIEWLEIHALLDERTTNICRTMDGMILDVRECRSLLTSGASVTKPEDIYDVNPFMREESVRDPKTGQIKHVNIYAGSGKKMATVTKPGFGVRDSRGKFDLHLAGKKLQENKVGLPPYHHKCRSYSVPRISQIQVPRGYSARSRSIPVMMPLPTPAASGAGIGEASRAKPLQAPAQRPIQIFRDPSLRKPAAMKGDNEFYDTVDIAVEDMIDGIISVISMEQSKKRRMLTGLETGRLLRSYAIKNAGRRPSRKRLQFADSETPEGMTPVNSYAAYQTGLQIAGDELWRYLEEMKLPPVFRITNAKPVYSKRKNIVVINSMSTKNTQLPHIIQHYIDTLGRNREASEYLRNRLAYHGRLVKLRDGEYSLQGPWVDPFDGIIYHTNPEWLSARQEENFEFTDGQIMRTFTTKQQPNEFMAMAAQRLRVGRELDLAQMWERVPEQVALYLIIMRGDFV